MQQKRYGKLMVPALAIFAVANMLILILKNKIAALHIDLTVITIGNCILFVLVAISLALHLKASRNKKPSVLVRSIMGSMLIKMLAVGIAAVVYVRITKEKRDITAVGTVMVLYLIYLIAEIKAALQLNKKQPADAGN